MHYEVMHLHEVKEDEGKHLIKSQSFSNTSGLGHKSHARYRYSVNSWAEAGLTPWLGWTMEGLDFISLGMGI